MQLKSSIEKNGDPKDTVFDLVENKKYLKSYLQATIYEKYAVANT